jgi:alpha-2-macroglobulin-like protein
MQLDRRDFCARPSLLAALAAAAVTAGVGAGCGQSGPTRHGVPDDLGSQNLRLDETAMTASAAGRELEVRLPVTNRGGSRSEGTLRLSLQTVDGLRVLERREIPYALDAGQAATLTGRLAIPADVTRQPDWVRYSVRVEGSSGASLRVTRSLLGLVPAHEVRLEGPSRVTRGRRASYRVRAEDPVTHQPIPDVPVQLIMRKGDQQVAALDKVTGGKGEAVFELTLDVEGDVEVEARATARGTTAALTDAASVLRPGAKVLLTTDKPLYQPGQTIHLRALALDGATQKPVAGQPAVFEIEDGKANKILKRTLTTDGYGLAATTFRLGAVLNMGTFKMRVAVGPDRTEKTVEVSRYALPKFKVEVGADRPFYMPGDTVGGTVEARYFFGKPVADAEVVIEASALDIGSSTFGRVVGRTDAQGRFDYSLALPMSLVGLPLQQGGALVSLDVRVTDGAGQKVKQARPLTVAAKPLRLALVPEATVLVPGVDNRVDLFVTDPLGSPIAGAQVEVGGGGLEQRRGTTDAFGHASFGFVPAAPNQRTVTVTATTRDGQTVSEGFVLAAQPGAEHVLVRTDRAVYGLGDTVAVEVRTSAARKVVYVDWVNNGQTVDMRTVEVQDGVGRFQMPIDAGLLGSSRVEAYIVNPDGNLVRAGRTIFVRNVGGLSVELATDQPQYTPGAPAQLTFTVKDETGAPAVAALGVQVVDEAVFALVDAKPGLLKTYFELEQSFAQPHYQVRAPAGDLTRLLLEETAQTDPAAAGAAQARAAATLAAIGMPFMGIQKGSWPSVEPAVAQALVAIYEAEKARLLPAVKAGVQTAVRRLTAAGCPPTSTTCAAKGMSYGQALRAEVAGAFAFWDLWGSAYTKGAGPDELLRLESAGPDEKASTRDDGTLRFLWTEVGLSTDVINKARPPVPTANGGGGAGGAGGGLPGPGGPAPGGNPSTPMSPPSGTGGSGGTADEPRVRQEFPETLYVNPQVITGADGKARVDVAMADSITSWRVSALAHTAAGKLGGGVGAVKVFQDFFVDVDFPATLTRGDEVDFPVAVYNYLDRPQTVHLELAPAPWYTARGPTTVDVALAPGQVTGVRFPVRVGEVGRQSLTVKGQGGQRADAVARSVLVEPDGKAIPVARSGALGAGELMETVTFPAAAIAGSQRLHLDLFPAYLSQVVQGMDSLLRVPNGCFEQTTSTAWPNVLVTAYLAETKQLKPDVQLKAESLMSAGYQRLLTFEHRGGGFSWFGEQDGQPYLSVTAFGLMEFADMAKVHPVDEAMLERTRRWLAGKQAADGSWGGDKSEFFSFHTSTVRNSAFVVWALASAGYSGPAIERGLGFVRQQLAKEKLDAYSLAIVANALSAAAPGDPALGDVLAQLQAAKREEGDKVSWDAGATKTNFYGQGDDARVATTALVVHALLLAGADKPGVDRGLAYLTAARDAHGNFGSTQATIWTLRTLLLASRKGTEGAVGSLAVAVDGQPFTTVTLTADQADVMTTIDLARHATAGSHAVGLRFTGTGKVSYNLVARHNIPWAMMPPPDGPLSVAVSYDKTRLAVDDTATATVRVRNNVASAQDMILVTVGLPPGFEVLTEDLDRYTADRTLSRYEITGKQLMLYLTALGPSAAKDISYRLRALMPVKAADGGAEIYAYYQPKVRAAAPATTLEVMATP